VVAGLQRPVCLIAAPPVPPSPLQRGLARAAQSVHTRRSPRANRVRAAGKVLLQRFLNSYNDACGPFTWTKGPERLQRIIETTKAYQAAHPPEAAPPERQAEETDTIKN
jgi:hypothetical protein